MFVSKKHLTRRTMLRGLGGALSLPLLDSMVPALTAQSRTAAKVFPRLGFVYVPHGAIMDRWTPANTTGGFELSPILKSLEPHKKYINVVSGPHHKAAGSTGRVRSRMPALGHLSVGKSRPVRFSLGDEVSGNLLLRRRSKQSAGLGRDSSRPNIHCKQALPNKSLLTCRSVQP